MGTAQRAWVVGLGKSGMAAGRLLHRLGWQVQVADRQDNPGLRQQGQELATLGIEVTLDQDPLVLPEPYPDLVVVSPGIPWDRPALVQARALGLDTIGEMELAWRHLQPLPWVGITGTNGKTTTTSLIAAIFQAAGRKAPPCGNIGRPGCDLVGEPLDWVVAEISSFQIESSPGLAPRIGVWTTFTPDHLDRHYTLERYWQIKAHLLAQAQIRILNGDDPVLRQRLPDLWPDAWWTSTRGRPALPANPAQGVYLEDGWVIAQEEPILAVDQFPMVGNHNHQNLLLAVATARAAGLPLAAIQSAMTQFPGVPHRLEPVGTWQGIQFINDSKATNYDAAQVGLAAVPAPVVLLAGGKAKEGDDLGWLATIQARAAAVVLFGAAAGRFQARLGEVGYTSIVVCPSLTEAVPQATTLARQLGVATVLLSPACASFDQYPNFEARGDHFRTLVRSLLTAPPI